MDNPKGAIPSMNYSRLSLPHYYRARVFDVMNSKYITIDTAECDSQVCEFHTPENVGQFIPTHPDTNYCSREAYEKRLKEIKESQSSEELVPYGQGYRPRCNGVCEDDGMRCHLQVGHSNMCVHTEKDHPEKIGHFFNSWSRKTK